MSELIAISLNYSIYAQDALFVNDVWSGFQHIRMNMVIPKYLDIVIGNMQLH